MRPEWDEIERHHRTLESPGQWFAVVVVLAVAAILASSYLSGRGDPAGDPDGSTNPVTSGDVTTVPGLQSTIDVPPSADGRNPSVSGASRRSQVHIYECLIDGQRVLSDQACAADARSRSLVIDRPDPVAMERLRQQQLQAQQRGTSTRSYSPPSVLSTNQGGGTVRRGGTEAACAAVDREIENLNARMRQGYGSTEGEWLRSEWHALKERRYDLGCGR